MIKRFLFFLLISLQGLVCSAQFQHADWITSSIPEDAGHRVPPVFLKSFYAGATLKSAKLVITALGLYEAMLNGERIGKDYFTPGFTDYDQRLQYQSYDLTNLLKKGQLNAIRVTVAEGWYRGVFRGAQARDNYGKQSGLLAVLVLTDSNGKTDEIGTGRDWLCTTGPILYSELYDGELYNSTVAEREPRPVNLLNYSKTILVPSEAPAVRQQEVFKPKASWTSRSGEQIIDFGQNIAGWARLTVTGHKGDTIRIRHAEMLDDQKELDVGNLREAKATDIYVLDGTKQVLEPHFTYHGFRYVGISGPAKAEAQAIALYSDLKKTGSFSCSDSLLNQLQSNIEWSLKDNFFDIPTDCPQRSERLGWTGDVQAFAGTANFLCDTKAFYTKWFNDLAVEQADNGSVPAYVPTVAPHVAQGYGLAGWSDVATILPTALFQAYGDTALLRQQYPVMKKWVDYVRSVSPNNRFTNKTYGDWYAMGENTDIAYIDQCFYAWSVFLLKTAAGTLHKNEDERYYASLLDSVKNAFGGLRASTQTGYVLALQFDLLPENQRQGAADSLVANILRNGDHLSTGFLGTPYLLEVLSRYRHQDVAYTLLQQQTCPSWLYPVRQGATTIWERWDAKRPDGSLQQCSFNHYAYGAVGQWLYERVLGITPAKPGYKTINIAPRPGGGLSWAKGFHETPFGKVEVSWQIKNQTFILDVTIPRGTTAFIRMPGSDTTRNLSAGLYHFVTNISYEK